MRRTVTLAAWLLMAVAGVTAGTLTLPQHGLRGRYFTNLTRSGEPIAVTIDPSITSATLATGTAAVWPSYSVEWTGAIVIDRPGLYEFATTSDDGSELEIGGRVVVQNGGTHGVRRAVGRIELASGIHPMRVRYEQHGGAFHLELDYALGGEQPSPIGANVLLPEEMSYTAYRIWRAVPAATGLVAVLLFAVAGRLAARKRVDRFETPGVLDRPRIAVITLVCIAVIARIIMMLGSNGILWGDSDVFMETVGAIRNGRWFEHDPYRTLLYPYFLAPFLMVSGEKPMDQVIVGAQHLLGVISVVALFVAGRAAFGTRIAFAGALLLALHTTQLFYENSILTEALFVCLLTVSLVIIVGFLQRPTLAGAVVVAAACLVLTLTRPAAQAFIAAPVAFTLFAASTWRRRVVYAAAMVAVYLLALPPWMAVNQRTFGFSGVALGRGLGLFIRTSQIERYEPSRYASYPEIVDLLTYARTTQSAAGHVVEGLRRRGYSSARADDLLYRASVSAIAQHPWQFAAASLRQWWRQLGTLGDEDICHGAEGAYVCSDRTIGYAREPFLNRPRDAAHQPLRRLVVGYFRYFRVPMHAVTVLAIFGVVATFSAASRVLLLRLFLVLTVVYFTLLPAITQSLQDRFRLPVDGLLFMLAAFGAVELMRVASRGRRE